MMDEQAKPVIVLKPTDLWRYRKDPVDWLRDERKTLQARCQREARRVVASRIPEPEQVAAGEPDRWDDLAREDLDRLYTAIFEHLVERSGAAPEFVRKLLARPVEDYVLEAVMERRAKLAMVWEQGEGDPTEQRKRVTEEARRVLRAFLEKMPEDRWDRFSPIQQDLRLAKLQNLVAERLELSLPEVSAALEAPMDALLHQERQRRETIAETEGRDGRDA